MSNVSQAGAADKLAKSRHRTMWASGDYPYLASELIPKLGRVLVEAATIGPGHRVLDVATGSGNAAIPAALAGADVVASDLTPELLDAGRREATHHGVEVQWREADVEALPDADGEYDVVVSCVGVMFAPHHQASADEMTRVLRRGGTLALINWTPEGFIGQMFGAMKPYAPPPPPGAQPPPLWGDPDHVTGLLGDRVDDVVAERRILDVRRFSSSQEFLDFFKAAYGPTISVYARIADDPEATAKLDQTLLDLADAHFRTDEPVMEWEYLLVTARRT